MLVAQPEPFSIDDYFALPDDGMRHELYDGALHVTPPPGNLHCLVTTRLRDALIPALPAGVLAVENLGLRLGAARLLVPDLTLVHRDVLVRDGRYVQASDVLAVVEVESPSSVRMDRLMKTALYAEGGVPMYLRVVPGGPEIHVHRLVGPVYEMQSAVAGELIDLDPFELRLDPTDVLR